MLVLVAQRSHHARRGFARQGLAFLLMLAFTSAAGSADQKHISVYAPVATYALPVVDRGGREYVGLLELLEPLGRVSATRDGSHWKLRYNTVESEFIAGKTRVTVRGRDFNLSSPFLIENSRGLVPIGSLRTLLPRFLDTPVTFRENARRLFIGNVATQPTLQLDPANPGKLSLNFGVPVNPTISTEPGRLRMLFKRDPVVPPSQPFVFDNRVITQVSFSESNGGLELDITSGAPLMASFSNGARTITVSAAQQPAAPSSTQDQGATSTPSVPAPVAPQPIPSSPSVTGPASGAPRGVLAVVDPAHGGSERGAALSDTVAEKNVTLGFARLLRHELEQRGFSVILSRDSDASVSLDQRAGMANAAHAAIFISLHAASLGTGARVYTSLLPVEGESKEAFHAWNVAQAPSLALSRSYAVAIVSEMQRRQIPAREFLASLRPLNNVVMPALAVELAPGPNGISDLSSANYQQQVAAAIADALAPFRDRLGGQP
jgi:N-acetylmuramoyl-L-alanine amidase